MQDDSAYNQLTNDVARLLMYLWRGIDPDFKSDYKMTIWSIFESRVKVSASQNSTLAGFVSSVCSKLKASIGASDDERSNALFLLQNLQDDEVLSLLREKTAFMILKTRVALDESYKHRKVNS